MMHETLGDDMQTNIELDVSARRRSWVLSVPQRLRLRHTLYTASLTPAPC